MYTTKHLHGADRLSVTPSEPTLANQSKIRAAYSPRRERRSSWKDGGNGGFYNNKCSTLKWELFQESS